MMASTDLIRDAECAGTLHLTIFLGLLLPSVLVSGESTMLPATSGATAATISSSPSPTNMIYGTAATASKSGGTATTTYTSIQANSGGSTSKTPKVTTLTTSTAIITPAQTPAMATSPGYRASSGPSPFLTLPSGGVTSATAKSGWLTNVPSTPDPSVSMASSRAVTAANTGNTFASTTDPAGNSTAFTWGMNGTSVPNNASTTMIYCPAFMCNYSDCYMMYTSQNATMCTAGYDYCQLIRQTDMCYAASCSASCADRCLNDSQTNCSVNCCNYTDCLNGSFASMMTMMTTTPVMSTSPMTESTTKMTTNRPTTADNRNKCHQGKCTGTNCYTTFGTTFQTCSSGQPHCQLKKESKGSTLEWTAGCTTNCSEKTPCKASTRPPCHLECCNATAVSCLWLNGTMNMPNSATGGSRRHRKWVAVFLGLLAFLL